MHRKPKKDNWRFLYWVLLFLFILATAFFSETDRFSKKEVLTKETPTATKVKKETKKMSEETKTSERKNKMDKKQIPGHLEDWQLKLVNRDNPIKEEPTDIGEFQGYPVDSKIIPPLTAMVAGAKKDNIDLVLVSGYRSVSYQEQLFKESLNEGLNHGLELAEAKKQALKYRTEPGTSEHHTGLACDFVDTAWNEKNGELIEDYGQEPGGKWLAQHAVEYGFIVRYPKNKEKETYIAYEPWHLRYVGIENAKYMKEHDLCLEEYVSLLKG